MGEKKHWKARNPSTMQPFWIYSFLIPEADVLHANNSFSVQQQGCDFSGFLDFLSCLRIFLVTICFGFPKT